LKFDVIVIVPIALFSPVSDLFQCGFHLLPTKIKALLADVECMAAVLGDVG
jgi:hypothetical protein